MDDHNEFSMNVSSIRAARTVIKVLGYLVYVLATLFATIVFSNHLSGQFPDSQWMRFMAYAGAWSNFGSLILMPIAKEYWVSGRSMTAASWLFWVGEFAIIVLNTLAAYGSSWAEWWTPLSWATPAVPIFIWGLLYYLNPEARAHQEQVNFYLESQQDFQYKLRKAMKSQNVQDIMNEGAAKAAEQYAEKSLGVVIDGTYKSKRRRAEGNGRATQEDVSQALDENPTRR